MRQKNSVQNLTEHNTILHNDKLKNTQFKNNARLDLKATNERRPQT